MISRRRSTNFASCIRCWSISIFVSMIFPLKREIQFFFMEHGNFSILKNSSTSAITGRYKKVKSVNIKMIIYNFYFSKRSCHWTPIGKFEARIFEACPNIQELHMHVTLDTEDSFNFFKTIRLKHLTTLTIKEVSLPKGETLCAKVWITRLIAVVFCYFLIFYITNNSKFIAVRTMPQAEVPTFNG